MEDLGVYGCSYRDKESCPLSLCVFRTDSQRQATMDAGKIAGIEFYELLMNQLPSLAYGLDKKQNETILVLIWVVVHLMFQF
jgi:hypothetical protein